MSFFPCAVHGGMFKGPAEATYPALVNGTTSNRVHRRMCHECFTSYVTSAESQLNEVGDGGPSPSDAFRVCCMCGGESGNTRLFITAYPKGEDPRQFFGAVCDKDIYAAGDLWLGASNTS